MQHREGSDAFNEPASLDLDFDGDGDTGQEIAALAQSANPVSGLPDVFTTYSANGNAVSGSVLEITLTFNGLESNDEGIYLDNIVVTTDAAGGGLSVITNAATAISQIGATLEGEITDTGGDDATERGFFYSTTDGFADGTGTKVSSTGTFGAGTFSEVVNGLDPATTYYYKAFATNGTDGTVYGIQFDFTTSDLPAPVATAVTAVGSTGFTANWGAVTGATGYRLDVYTETAGSLTTETFTGIGGGTSSSYLTRSWTGDGGIDWTAYNARVDQEVDSGNEAITLRNASGAYLESGEISGSITQISFDVKQVFSGSGGELTVKVLHGASFSNETTVGTISYTATKATFDETVTGITGNYKIRIDNNTSARPAIDNLAFGSASTQTFLTGFQDLDVGNVISYAVTGATADTEYNYVVRATDGANTSADSNSITVTTSATSPEITAVGTPGAMTTTFGTASAAESFTVSGTDLTEGILVTPPSGFEVSTSIGSGYAATLTVGGAGTVANTTVYIRLAADTLGGTYSGNVVLSSAGATDVDVATTASTVNYTTIQQWRVDNNLAPDASNTADSDADGRSNLEEFAFGTDPDDNLSGSGAVSVTDANSFLPGSPVVRTILGDGNPIRLRFVRRKDFATVGLTYTTNFTDSIGALVASTPNQTIVSDAGGDYEVVEVKFPLFDSLGQKATALFATVEVSLAN